MFMLFSVFLCLSLILRLSSKICDVRIKTHKPSLEPCFELVSIGRHTVSMKQDPNFYVCIKSCLNLLLNKKKNMIDDLAQVHVHHIDVFWAEILSLNISIGFRLEAPQLSLSKKKRRLWIAPYAIVIFAQHSKIKKKM